MDQDEGVKSSPNAPVEPQDLDLGYLCLFVGMRLNDLVLEALHRAGFRDLRHAHGYVFQHLVGGPRAVSDLARCLDVSQQAASKAVAELVELGYLEDAPSRDRRARTVRLSKRGRSSIARARAIRRGLERRIRERHGSAPIENAKSLLAQILEDLGGADAVRARRIRAPR